MIIALAAGLFLISISVKKEIIKRVLAHVFTAAVIILFLYILSKGNDCCLFNLPQPK
jgi:hypothetical protein